MFVQLEKDEEEKGTKKARHGKITSLTRKLIKLKHTINDQIFAFITFAKSNTAGYHHARCNYYINSICVCVCQDIVMERDLPI